MADLTSLAVGLVRLYGPLALFLFSFLETSMLFPLLPSEVVVPAAAALLITDAATFLVFVLAASVGGTLGAFVPFTVFRDSRIGETDWLRDHIGVSTERLERWRAWFRRWGQTSVIWGRFLPVVRSVVSIPAGFAGMSSTRFAMYTAGGTLGFYSSVGGLVYYTRQQSLFATAAAVATNRPVLAALVALVVLVIALLGRRWYRHRTV